MRTIAIDPGVQYLGVAVFDCGALITAYLHKYDDTLFEHINNLYRSELEIVLEKPQVYPRQKGDPNDLIDLAAVAGAVAGAFGMAAYRYHDAIPNVVFYKPRVWKGQVPKDVHHQRIRAVLEKRTEIKNVQIPRAKSLAHNVWDAIGLGLYHLTQKRN